MQARLLDVASDSVYVIGPDDRLWFIPRAEEGLWGGWQEAGATARSLVHAGPVIGRIGLDGRVAALQRRPSLPWQTWDVTATELAAAHLPDGAPALFARHDDGTLSYTWKPSPSEPWSAWEPLGGPVSSIAAGRIPGGGLVAFGVTEDEVRHRWQNRPGGSWEAWTALGAPGSGARAVRATSIDHGGLALFALDAGGRIHHRWQDKAFRPWHEWELLGEDVESFDITRSAAGGLAVLAIGRGREVRCRFQAKRFGEWSRWVNLGGDARSVVARPGYVDGLEAFIVAMNGEVYHNWCDRPDEQWSGWRLLDRETPSIGT
jgi:hypothetical protein